MKDIPFTDVGIVCARHPLQGSFCNVTLEYSDGRKSTLRTICLDQGLTFPALGESIRINGVVRNGRHLTTSWERV